MLMQEDELRIAAVDRIAARSAPHLVPVLHEHLSKHIGKQQNSLLFPAKRGGHLALATTLKLTTLMGPLRLFGQRSGVERDLRHAK